MGHYFYCITLLFSLVSSYSIFGQKSVVFDADEINASVTIKTDQWGVSHIYAANERDLFFAQGFQAARDRLFQFEMFRRQATGTLAEVLGEKDYPALTAIEDKVDLVDIFRRSDEAGAHVDHQPHGSQRPHSVVDGSHQAEERKGKKRVAPGFHHARRCALKRPLQCLLLQGGQDST